MAPYSTLQALWLQGELSWIEERTYQRRSNSSKDTLGRRWMKATRRTVIVEGGGSFSSILRKRIEGFMRL
jgi:hypothetical protein